MLDKDIALEALGVVCNATVTSVRKQRADAGSGAALQAPCLAFRDLSLSDSAAPTQLSLNQLICTVLDGDQTCPAARYTLAAIRSDLYDGRPPAARSAGLTGPNAHIKLDVGEENGRIFIVDEDDFFHPRFNYDFTGLKDTETYYRGGEKYQRPCGWQRFALKVLDKYDGNEWLGTTGRSTESVQGEWPVSYHGTSEDGAEGIIKEYYKVLDKYDGNEWLGTKGRTTHSVMEEWPVSYHGTTYQGAEGIIKECYKSGMRNAYGTGIYSTPDIKLAERKYSSEFTKNGKRYKVILQNRINPKYRKICEKKDYWLVEIDPELPEEEKKRLVERAIRPYGLLLKEV